MKRILYIGNFIASSTQYVTASEILSDKLQMEGYQVLKTSDKLNKSLRLLDMIWTMTKNRNQTDVILIDTFSTINFYGAFLCSQWARLLNLPYINILHGGNLPMRLQKDPFLSKLIFKNAKSLVAPSNYLKDEFERNGYVVKMIPNIIFIEHYIYKERQQIEPKLLWVRAFDQIYNPEMAIEVLKLLVQKYPQAELCMVGPVKDSSYNNTFQLVNKYGLESQVKFTGVLSKSAWHQLAAQYDIFINTTNIDNTPVSVIEAMALGLPVISTNAGGMLYLMEHNIDGVLVNKNDAKAMAAAICLLIQNPIIAVEMTQKAREKAAQMEWNVVKYQWNKVLNDV